MKAELAQQPYIHLITLFLSDGFGANGMKVAGHNGDRIIQLNLLLF
jgi:hypothetical protein